MASPLTDIDDYQDGPLGRAFMRYYASQSIGLELGAGMGYLQAEDGGRYFNSLIYPIDARVVLQPASKGQIQPFLFAGIGLLVFDAEDQTGNPLTRNARGEYGTTTAYVPLGIGAEYYLNDRYAFGLNGSYNLTMTDNLDDLIVGVSRIDGHGDQAEANRGPLAEHFEDLQQRPAVLAARHSHHHPIAVSEQVEVGDGSRRLLREARLERGSVCHEHKRWEICP